MPRTILFAGAGVSARAGLPDWAGYIEQLAHIAAEYGDPDSASLIRKRVEKRQWLAAASVYKTADIPAGERLKRMAAPFAHPVASEKRRLLDPLFSLPVSAAVTTNYDRLLHDGFSRIHNETPVPLELDDQTLKNGAIRSEFFVARIHGRAQKPETMILDTADYESLDVHPEYLDFLLAILTQRPCLFIGFSFADPAITKVLTVYKAKAGPAFPTLHHVLLPSDASPNLKQLLQDTNVRVLSYDAVDHHKALWSALGTIARDPSKPEKSLKTPPATPLVPEPTRSAFHRFFAFSYAQLKSRAIQPPLLEISEDGLVSSLVHDSGAEGVSEVRLINRVRRELHINEMQARQIASNSLTRLVAGGEVARDGDVLVSTAKARPVYDKNLAVLTTGVLSRMRVREGVSVTGAHKAAVAPVLEQVFIVRAWDLAAHYAGATGGIAADLPTVIEQLVQEQARKQIMGSIEAFSRSVVELIQSPTEKESELLSELGRTAFAVQLVLSSPRQSLAQRYSLPQRVYFDANVLMPAITEGHPLSAAYRDVIKRLQTASRSVGSACELAVGAQFLEEIVAHRAIAIDTVRELGLESADRLAKHILFYGGNNINVFIAAYGSVKGTEQNLKFSDFLARVAPYSSITRLASYVEDQGIATLDMSKCSKSTAYDRIFASLLSGYERDRSNRVRPKEKRLIHHEAEQLTALNSDITDRMRTVFITADLRLQRIVQTQNALRHLVGGILSQVGFVGLVDIMVGLDADSRSIARLIWGIPRSEAQQTIRDYLIRRAVDQYNAVLLMAVPTVVDEIAADAAREATKRKIDLFAGNHSVSDASKAARFIDQVEDKFYESMAGEMDRIERASEEKTK